MPNGDYNMSGAQVLLAYLQQSTRVGMRQLQQREFYLVGLLSYFFYVRWSYIMYN